MCTVNNRPIGYDTFKNYLELSTLCKVPKNDSYRVWLEKYFLGEEVAPVDDLPEFKDIDNRRKFIKLTNFTDKKVCLPVVEWIGDDWVVVDGVKYSLKDTNDEVRGKFSACLLLWIRYMHEKPVCITRVFDGRDGLKPYIYYGLKECRATIAEKRVKQIAKRLKIPTEALFMFSLLEDFD